MKRILVILKNNKITLIALIIGLLISSTTTILAAISAGDIIYDNSTSALNSTRVQGAVDELYTLQNNKKHVTTSSFDYDEEMTMFTIRESLCFFEGSSYAYAGYCLDNKDIWAYKKSALRNILRNATCYDGNDYIECYNTKFYCIAYKSGGAECRNKTTGDTKSVS